MTNAHVSQCMIWSTGVDYITMTYAADDGMFPKMQDICDMLFYRREKDGHPTKEGKVRDYYGRQCNGLFTGARGDGYIVQASSECAEFIAQLAIANGCDGKVTRIDFQVTVRFAEDFRKRASAIREQLRAKEAKRNGTAEMGLALMEGHRNGDSIAFGSRSSERYYRVYDKSREQNGKVASNLWRWEVEYKGGKAVMAWLALANTGSTIHFPKSMVASEFTRLGLYDEWMAHTPTEQFPSCYVPTDNERRLRWLQNNVRATVKQLERDGLKEEALDSLGLL